jgi:hypothetical protein
MERTEVQRGGVEQHSAVIGHGCIFAQRAGSASP